MKKRNLVNSFVCVAVLTVSCVNAVDSSPSVWQSIKAAFSGSESQLVQKLRTQMEQLMNTLTTLPADQKKEVLVKLAALKIQAQQTLATEQNELMEKIRLNMLSADQKAVLEKNIQSLQELIGSFKSQLSM